jgi:hypothetical protein
MMQYDSLNYQIRTLSPSAASVARPAMAGMRLRLIRFPLLRRYERHWPPSV